MFSALGLLEHPNAWQIVIVLSLNFSVLVFHVARIIMHVQQSGHDRWFFDFRYNSKGASQGPKLCSLDGTKREIVRSVKV